jgi:hypothetical protein
METLSSLVYIGYLAGCTCYDHSFCELIQDGCKKLRATVIGCLHQVVLGESKGP